MGVDPTVHRAYVTNVGSNTVTVIDTTTNAVMGTPIPVGSGPVGVGVDPTVHRAYVANRQQHGDGDRHDDQHRRGHPHPGGSSPIGVAVDPTVHRAYVANSTATP